MSNTKNQTTSKTNCGTGSTDAFSTCGPVLYYHPNTHELIEVSDDELERESQYLCDLVIKKRVLQFKIDELNDKYPLQLRERNPQNYQQELLALYQKYDVASEELNSIIQELKEIQENEQGEEIPITSLDSNSKGFDNSILELIQLKKGGGYKYSYIRSDKLGERHVIHKLGKEDIKSETSKLIKTETIKNTETGEEIEVRKIDTQELKKQLSEIAPTLKYQLFELENKNYSTLEKFKDDDNWVGGLYHWAENINKSLDSTPPYRGKYASFDKKAQLMRFSYGGDSTLELTKGNIGDPSNPKASAKISLYANLALAEAKTEGKIHLPSRHGIQIRYPKKGMDELALMGALRFDLILTLSGHVGASVGLQGSANISQNGIIGIPSKTSVDAPKDLNEVKGIDITSKADELGVVAQAEIFAGIKVGAGIGGELLWLNPEKKEDDNDGFSSLGTLAASIEGLLGAGASGAFAFTYFNGKILVTVQGGLCWGAGAKGSTSFEINADKIMSKFMPCFGYMLRDMDYEKLVAMIRPEHFYAICSLPLLIGMEVTNISYRFAQELQKELKLSWDNKNNRVSLMNTIINSKGEFLKYCPPETKGAAIAALLEHNFWDKYFSPASHSQASGEAMAIFSQRKRAILHTLRWAQSQRDFENILQHASLIPSDSKDSIAVNKTRILAFLAEGEAEKPIPNHAVSRKVTTWTPIPMIKPSYYADIFQQIEKKLPDSNLAKIYINEPYQEFITASEINSQSDIFFKS
ncbi:hypothetical protein [Providencia burhodogranariea]|uniref:Uncharacterized protein n=1 Tax=Providencia burhodogranariea DSM 19968 TaxID=1141662 RepID=K8W8G7_9GAMM|nr:hypothetical protein [Providencia burhodogranariea]EKT56166.1 hypothetical protein OOA_15347 [Providencia burhodogranariea DSM 19968]